jgi:hypothetical protein
MFLKPLSLTSGKNAVFRTKTVTSWYHKNSGVPSSWHSRSVLDEQFIISPNINTRFFCVLQDYNVKYDVKIADVGRLIEDQESKRLERRIRSEDVDFEYDIYHTLAEVQLDRYLY